jgi:hypothetical protein
MQHCGTEWIAPFRCAVLQAALPEVWALIDLAQKWTDAHSRLTILLVFGGSFAAQFLVMDTTLNIFDEGLVLVGAMRTLAGDLVHRDFYSTYGPGSYYILAALFTVTPDWFVAGRIFGVAVMAGVVAAVFGLLARRTWLPVTLLFTALTGLWMVGTRYYLYPMFPTILLALTGSALVLRYLSHMRPWPLFLAGCMAGAAALFRYDTGFFIALLHALTLAAVLWLRRTGDRPILGQIARSVAIYAAGAIMIFAPFAIALLVGGGLDGWLADIVDYSLNHYSAMRGLPFPGLREVVTRPGNLGVYVPPLAVVLGAWVMHERTRANASAWGAASEGPRLAALLLFTLATAIFYYKGIVRVSTLHMLLAIVPAMIVLALAIDHWRERGQNSRLRALAVLLAAIAPAVAYGIGIKATLLPGRAPAMAVLQQAGLQGVPTLPGQECARPTAMTLAVMEPDYLRVSDFIRRNTLSDEVIFVALDRHDKTFVNPVSLYFATGRLPATHWHQFDPGLQTRADIQQLMVADLQRSGVRWVVRDSSFSNENEPNQSSVSSGVVILDRYLGQNFRPVARSGKLEIWLANTVLAPADLRWADCLKNA